VGGVMRWQFASASQRTPPRHANAWQRPSIYSGGAVRITSTHGIHHRRNLGEGAKHKPHAERLARAGRLG
jgi:hypothetical protein